tara:strand:- start:53 stop:832 length:780 start_codon:yes stop_codon:yes gene_type:complete
MINKFFTVSVKPTIPAYIQHAGQYSGGDVLFDWTAVQIPKGSCLLRSVTAMFKPKGDATPTANRFGFELLFSSTDTVSLGTLHANVAHTPSSDFLGRIEFEAANFAHTSVTSTAVATSGKGSNTGMDLGPIVLTPKLTDAVNDAYNTPGYDTVYVGGVATSADIDFSTINRVNETDAAAGTQSVITMDGSGMDITEHFAVGDILHGHDGSGTDDVVLGEVLSVDSATQFTLTAGTTGALREDDFVYDVNPIKLVLSFEK